MLDALHPRGVAIFVAADLPLNTPKLLGNTPTLVPEGFDEISSSYLVRSNLTTEQEVAAYFFPKGRQLAGHTMWVRKSSASGVVPGMWKLDVDFQGMLGEAIRYTRKTDANVQQSAGSDVLLTTPGGYPFNYPDTPISLLVSEAAPTVRTSYVTTTAPDLTKVGQTVYAANPLPPGYPALPDAPETGWTSLPDPQWVYPSGWVLDARPSDEIRNEAGVAVCWFIQDIHAWYHPARPNR